MHLTPSTAKLFIGMLFVLPKRDKVKFQEQINLLLYDKLCFPCSSADRELFSMLVSMCSHTCEAKPKGTKCIVFLYIICITSFLPGLGCSAHSASGISVLVCLYILQPSKISIQSSMLHPNAYFKTGKQTHPSKDVQINTC